MPPQDCIVTVELIVHAGLIALTADRFRSHYHSNTRLLLWCRSGNPPPAAALTRSEKQTARLFIKTRERVRHHLESKKLFVGETQPRCETTSSLRHGTHLLPYTLKSVIRVRLCTRQLHGDRAAGWTNSQHSSRQDADTYTNARHVKNAPRRRFRK